MATPTLSDVRAVAVAWWQEPGLPVLDDLIARVAALFTDPGAIIRGRIENQAGVYTLVLELERAGTIVTRSWTPTNGVRQETLGQIYCATYGCSIQQYEAKIAAGG